MPRRCGMIHLGDRLQFGDVGHEYVARGHPGVDRGLDRAAGRLRHRNASVACLDVNLVPSRRFGDYGRDIDDL